MHLKQDNQFLPETPKCVKPPLGTRRGRGMMIRLCQTIRLLYVGGEKLKRRSVLLVFDFYDCIWIKSSQRVHDLHASIRTTSDSIIDFSNFKTTNILYFYQQF